MTGYQLQKTTRNWQGLSDPIACRGGFSSLPGAYPRSSHGKGATPLRFKCCLGSRLGRPEHAKATKNSGVAL